MTEPIAEASDTDLAGQASVADDPGDETQSFSTDGEADPADVLEQHQSVPSGEDDYDR